ncbi:MAG: PAS domain S-box protein, partial [Proteobacteria bacterium]
MDRWPSSLLSPPLPAGRRARLHWPFLRWSNEAAMHRLPALVLLTSLAGPAIADTPPSAGYAPGRLERPSLYTDGANARPVFAALANERAPAMDEVTAADAAPARDWYNTLIYGLPGLVMLVIALGVVIRINRRLTSEISQRIALEHELRSSEYHYRGLVESLSAIAWEADTTDYTYSYVSPHAEALLGYPLQSWLEPGFWQRILHPEDARRARAYCSEQTAAGVGHALEYRVITADGRSLWVRDIVSLIKHDLRPVMRGLMIDISETKKIEEAQRLSEQKFASVFRQCPDILVIARLSDGCLLEVNEAFEEQIGLKAPQVVGRRAAELDIWGVDGVA